MRLDNVVYRLGFGSSRNQARQLARHGRVTINGRKADIPSYEVAVGDVVSVRTDGRQDEYFKELPAEPRRKSVPDWLTLDAERMTGRTTGEPTRRDVAAPVAGQPIVAFDSR